MNFSLFVGWCNKKTSKTTWCVAPGHKPLKRYTLLRFSLPTWTKKLQIKLQLTSGWLIKVGLFFFFRHTGCWKRTPGPPANAPHPGMAGRKLPFSHMRASSILMFISRPHHTLPKGEQKVSWTHSIRRNDLMMWAFVNVLIKVESTWSTQEAIGDETRLWDIHWMAFSVTAIFVRRPEWWFSSFFHRIKGLARRLVW